MNWNEKLYQFLTSQEPECIPCLIKALTILAQNENCNDKKNELMNLCRHQTKYLLKNQKENKNIVEAIKY